MAGILRTWAGIPGKWPEFREIWSEFQVTSRIARKISWNSANWAGIPGEWLEFRGVGLESQEIIKIQGNWPEIRKDCPEFLVSDRDSRKFGRNSKEMNGIPGNLFGNPGNMPEF